MNITALVMLMTALGSIDGTYESTCRIHNPNGASGTGCCTQSASGYIYILTNHHVVALRSPSQSEPHGSREVCTQVDCTFWHAGHQSSPLAAAVYVDSPEIDSAIVVIQASQFGTLAPPVIPIAKSLPQIGEAIYSVGCPGGAWANGFIGHVVSYNTQECGEQLAFVPPPAGGRSGSAITNTKGELVALLHAADVNGPNGYGITVRAIKQNIDAKALITIHNPGRKIQDINNIFYTQCGPGGCCPGGQCPGGQCPGGQCPGGQCPGGQCQQNGPYILPHPFIGAQEPETHGLYPTVPVQPVQPVEHVNLDPVLNKLDRLADILAAQKPIIPDTTGRFNDLDAKINESNLKNQQGLSELNALLKPILDIQRKIDVDAASGNVGAKAVEKIEKMDPQTVIWLCVAVGVGVGLILFIGISIHRAVAAIKAGKPTPLEQDLVALRSQVNTLATNHPQFQSLATQLNSLGDNLLTKVHTIDARLATQAGVQDFKSQITALATPSWLTPSQAPQTSGSQATTAGSTVPLKV